MPTPEGSGASELDAAVRLVKRAPGSEVCVKRSAAGALLRRRGADGGARPAATIRRLLCTGGPPHMYSTGAARAQAIAIVRKTSSA
eukprot:CAMPEP_0176215688 /NCGR_PEP_ID=MMETSP0121_2-20121125/16808_1 /TAXON_ID=160619 /ORGANISM="Kryptoperidinium foliaceum, Strain CCMP 1326" /LENGTH=85 /DNA_ID=CAMNT_0017554799 /DNA_START=195 /DNA_END=450 /DNA_ORIENTATION=-